MNVGNLSDLGFMSPSTITTFVNLLDSGPDSGKSPIQLPLSLKQGLKVKQLYFMANQDN